MPEYPYNLDPTHAYVEAWSPISIEAGRLLVRHGITCTEDYPSPGNRAQDGDGIPFAFRYPGQRPSTSFVVAGESVEPCAVVSGDSARLYVNTAQVLGGAGVFDLGDCLRIAEAVGINERVPVIAFGSNANPGQLVQKFASLQGADRYVVPTITARVRGVASVYAARIGVNGYVFADLYPTDESVESRVHINLLSRPQLARMTKTEGAYSLCKMTNVVLETQDGSTLTTGAYLYVGREDGRAANILADQYGRPIRLAEIEASGEVLQEQFAVMSQTEVQQYIFGIAAKGITVALMLQEVPRDPADLVWLLIRRETDTRLDDFRQAHSTERLSTAVGRCIQQAIVASDRTIPASGLRRVIPKEDQNIASESVQTLGQLISK